MSATTFESATYDVKPSSSWDAPTEGWVIKFIKKNLWRVAPDMEFEDLYQELCLVYARCQAKRPDSANLMPYFMMAASNEVHSLATRRTRRRDHEIAGSQITDEVKVVEEAGFSEDLGDADFRLLLADKAELRRLFTVLVQNEIKPRRFWSRKNKVRETPNEFICRILGVDPTQVDMSGYITNLLGVKTCA